MPLSPAVCSDATPAANQGGTVSLSMVLHVPATSTLLWDMGCCKMLQGWQLAARTMD
jgi:hypothetical protein